MTLAFLGYGEMGLNGYTTAHWWLDSGTLLIISESLFTSVKWDNMALFRVDVKIK